MAPRSLVMLFVAVLLACAARGTESRDLVDRAADAAHGLGRLVGTHVDNGLSAAKKLGHIIGKEFKSVDKELSQLSKSVGKTVSHGSKDIGKAVEKAVDRHEHTMEHAVKKAVKTVEHTHAANAKAKHDAIRKVSKVLRAQHA